MAILASDIGGTKTLLRLAEVAEGKVSVLFEQRYASADYPEFLPLVQAFLADVPAQAKANITGACFGVAGPVKGRTANTTHLPWQLDADQLEQILNIPHVQLINDFQAVGYGIEVLPPQDIVTLQAGQPPVHGTRAVIGAGTGLGHGILVWQDTHYAVLPSEGGHADFAPNDIEQRALLAHIQSHTKHATWETVLSGKGLVNIYNYLATKHPTSGSEFTAKLEEAADKAALISEYGLAEKDDVAKQAVDLFVAVYGSQTANFALNVMATGGIYVAGGIAPKMIQAIQSGGFMRAFLNKYAGMQHVLTAIPVKVVLNAEVGLLGCCAVAARL